MRDNQKVHEVLSHHTNPKWWKFAVVFDEPSLFDCMTFDYQLASDENVLQQILSQIDPSLNPEVWTHEIKIWRPVTKPGDVQQ